MKYVIPCLSIKLCEELPRRLLISTVAPSQQSATLPELVSFWIIPWVSCLVNIVMDGGIP